MKRVVSYLMCLALTIGICFCFSACGNNITDNKQDSYIYSQLSGKWVSDNGELVEFSEDGTCEYNYKGKEYGAYELKAGNKITFSYSEYDFENNVSLGSYYLDMTYSIEGDTLILGDKKYKKK